MPQYEQKQDFELVNLLVKGDQYAFTTLYNRYWDKLYVVAYNRLEDTTEAEDIVQDVFISLWKRRSYLSLQHSISTYLSMAVKYQVINRFARRDREQRYQSHINNNKELGENILELWLNEKELMSRLEQSINELPKKCRIVFEMSRKEGKTTKQIAEQLNISPKTVEAHITKALSTIRKSLKILNVVLFCLLNQ